MSCLNKAMRPIADISCYLARSPRRFAAKASRAPHIARAGAVIGEAALLAEVTRPATALATQNARVLRITRHVFQRVLGEFPQEAGKLRVKMAGRTRALAKELEALRARALG